MNRVHVVGGGMAGLAAALALVDAGRAVTLYEAGPAAGGRCRSYFDRELGCRIDNGNHLWLSGNADIAAFLRRVGAEATVTGPAQSCFPFMDLRDGARWTVRPNAGLVPWWVLAPGRSVPGARLKEFAGLLALLRAGPDATVAQTLRPGALYDKLLEPLVIAALNTAPATGSAKLMAAVVRETLARGGSACRPQIPREGLSASFIDPALAALQRAGATLRLGCRVGALVVEGGRVAGLSTPDGVVTLGASEAAILAVPGPVAADRWCRGCPPRMNSNRSSTCITGSTRRRAPRGSSGCWAARQSGFSSSRASFPSPSVPQTGSSIGGPSDLAATVWPEVSAALCLSQPIPAFRVVKEKRATFAATPLQDRKRPAANTALGNLVLAGDWTATGLPATIEGAIRSGRIAAQHVLDAA